MHKLLYIGPYYTKDIRGRRAGDFIEALKHTACELHARAVYLGYDNFELDKYKQYETKIPQTFDTILLDCPPQFMCKHKAGKQTIGIFHNDYGYDYNTIKYFNLLDGLIVFSHDEVQDLMDKGVKAPIYFIHHPINVDVCRGTYPPFNNFPPGYNFYFVGDDNYVNNIEAILLAFHREFTINENVNLTLCLTNPGDPQQFFNFINQKIAELKKKSKIYHSEDKYIRENIITNVQSEQQIYSLHTICDAFISTARFNTFSYNIYEAALFGNYIVCPWSEHSNHEEFIGTTSNKTPFNGPPEYLFTAKNMCNEPNIQSLSNGMRSLVQRSPQNRFELQQKMRRTTYENHNYQSVGKAISKCLTQF